MERRIEMGKRIHHIREVNEEENAELRRLASSRMHPFRTVQRAKRIVSMLDDKTLTATQAGKNAGFKWVCKVLVTVRRDGVSPPEQKFYAGEETSPLRCPQFRNVK